MGHIQGLSACSMAILLGFSLPFTVVMMRWVSTKRCGSVVRNRRQYLVTFGTNGHNRHVSVLQAADDFAKVNQLEIDRHVLFP